MKLFELKLISLVLIQTIQVFGFQSSQMNKVASYVREGTASFEGFLSHLRRETRSFNLLRLKSRHAKSRFNTARNFLSEELQQLNDKHTEKLSDLTNIRLERNLVQNNITTYNQNISSIVKEIDDLVTHPDRYAFRSALQTLRDAKANQKWAYRDRLAGNGVGSWFAAIFSLGITEIVHASTKGQVRADTDELVRKANNNYNIAYEKLKALDNRLEEATKDHEAESKHLAILTNKEMKLQPEIEKLKKEVKQLGQMDEQFKKSLPILEELLNTAKFMVDATVKNRNVVDKFTDLENLADIIFNVVDKLVYFNLEVLDSQDFKNTVAQLRNQLKETKKAWNF